MNDLVEQATATVAPTGTQDLVGAIQRVLAESAEPLTVPKIKSHLPAALRGLNVEEALQRQVAANVLVQYPKYRSQHDRFWDRPMPQHVAWLVQEGLQDGPLPLSELRRKVPEYALAQLDAVLQEQLTQGRLHRHPKLTARGGERFGVRTPEAKDYAGQELAAAFVRLKELGFSETQVRTGMLDLLHDQEWGPASALPPPKPKREKKAKDEAAPASTDAGAAN